MHSLIRKLFCTADWSCVLQVSLFGWCVCDGELWANGQVQSMYIQCSTLLCRLVSANHQRLLSFRLNSGPQSLCPEERGVCEKFWLLQIHHQFSIQPNSRPFGRSSRSSSSEYFRVLFLNILALFLLPHAQCSLHMLHIVWRGKFIWSLKKFGL